MKKIKLRGKYGSGKYVYVDDYDYEKLSKYKWFLQMRKNGKYGYVCTRVGKNPHKSIHRMIMGDNKNLIIDHINKNTLDNRRCNLRWCTNRENQRNASTHLDKKMINGIIPPRGISFDKTRPNRPWYGRIKVNGKRIYTKGFSNIEDAIEKYNELIKKNYGEFSSLVSLSNK